MNPEKKFQKWLQSKIPGHWQNLEALNSPGLPDVNVCYRGVEVWLELKGEKVWLRRHQYAWGMRRAKVGGRCFILGHPLEDSIWIWKYPFSVMIKGEYVLPHISEMNVVGIINIDLLCSLLFDNPRL